MQGHKEKLLVCPYNPAHVIDPLRMAIHLIKCKKQYPDMDMTICPFNATHHVNREKLSSHIRECKDKAIVDRALFLKGNPDILVLSGTKNESVDSKEETVDAETWDQEVENSLSYNPLKNIIYKEVSRIPPTGLGKAGKKNWRQVDCTRIKRLREGLPIEDLVYPTLDGEISIYEIINGHEAKREDLQSARPKLKKSVNSETKNLRRPRIVANIFNNVKNEKDTSNDEELDRESTLSSKDYETTSISNRENNENYEAKSCERSDDINENVCNSIKSTDSENGIGCSRKRVFEELKVKIMNDKKHTMLCAKNESAKNHNSRFEFCSPRAPQRTTKSCDSNEGTENGSNDETASCASSSQFSLRKLTQEESCHRSKKEEGEESVLEHSGHKDPEEVRNLRDCRKNPEEVRDCRKGKNSVETARRMIMKSLLLKK